MYTKFSRLSNSIITSLKILCLGSTAVGTQWPSFFANYCITVLEIFKKYPGALYFDVDINSIQSKSIPHYFYSSYANLRPILTNSRSIPIPTNSSQFQFQFQFQPIPVNSNFNSNQFQAKNWNWDWSGLELVHPYLLLMQ